MKIYNLCILVGLTFVLFTNCKKESETPSIYGKCLKFSPGEEEQIIEALLLLEDNTCIQLAEGNYSFENLSIVGVSNVLFKGAGSDKTTLDFSIQVAGGEGINVADVTNFIIRDMKITDSKGDLLKIRNGTNIEIKNVHAIWTSDADSSNGGYGLYPVLCTNVLIDSCFVRGASDAGIYVGQSDQVLVQNSEAYMNVAGCEIENTTNAEVKDNEFHGNTGGLLIFDLPGLSKRGGFVKAHDNFIHDNNLVNFAPSSSFGTSTGVGNTPPGSGILHVATSNVEIYDNIIKDNNLASIYVVSGIILDENALDYIGPNYYPFPANVYIHDNNMSKKRQFPAAAYQHELGSLLITLHELLNLLDPFRHPYLQHIIIDGFNSNTISGGTAANPDNLCIEESEPVLFLNLDFADIGTPQWRVSTNVNPYNCP
jgi:parallel beta-helix repeat protein